VAINRLEVEYADEGKANAIVRILPVDTTAFERAYKMTPVNLQPFTGEGRAQQVNPDYRSEYIRYVTWNALRRAGFVSEAFDTWDATVAEVSDPDDAEGVCPACGQPKPGWDGSEAPDPLPTQSEQ